jgi:hypothetical protein
VMAGNTPLQKGLLMDGLVKRAKCRQRAGDRLGQKEQAIREN